MFMVVDWFFVKIFLKNFFTDIIPIIFPIVSLGVLLPLLIVFRWNSKKNYASYIQLLSFLILPILELILLVVVAIYRKKYADEIIMAFIHLFLPIIGTTLALSITLIDNLNPKLKSGIYVTFFAILGLYLVLALYSLKFMSVH
jgi:hypothetical protein